MATKPIVKKKPWHGERKPFEREKGNQDFYNSSKWRKTSKAFRMLNPLCVECERNGKVSASNVADHIRGLGFLLKKDMDPYDHKELQPLCSSCHNRKSGSESKNGRAYPLKT